jgi:thiopurine S-methyltransferase
MDPEFWNQRWRERQIGFHQSAPHPFLERWWPTLGVVPGARVYVPLCGKSLDMVWLAVRGYGVVGSEISQLAVEEFFGEQQQQQREHQQQPHQHGQPQQQRPQPADVTIAAHGPFQVHRHGQFELLQGDALQLTPELLGPVHAAYDRAALVALPPSMRESYAANFARLMPPGSRTLLVAFEYAQQVREGPPFSVEPDEVQQLYGASFHVDVLERVDIIDESPRFAAAGLDALFEVAYALTRS